jgi:acetoin utilization protein AcuB
VAARSGDSCAGAQLDARQSRRDMPKIEPSVAQFMTHDPASADEGLRLSDAQERMFMDNIRHLVVRRGDHLSGVLSSRDIALALALPGVDPETITVRDAMSSQPYVCAPDTPISEVAREMEAHRYGCAIVIEGDDVLGVFTTTDALRALRQLATGEIAEPQIHADHLAPTSPAHARPFRLRSHRPIDQRAGAMFSTQLK